MENKAEKTRALCDSLPWEGQGGVPQRCTAAKPLPATSQAAAPFPREGVLAGITLLNTILA